MSLIKIDSQQKMNWECILYGDFASLKMYKIKTLKLKKHNKILRSVEIDPEKLDIITKDSLKTNYFRFDSENKLISLKTIKNKNLEEFELKYKNGYVKWFSQYNEDNNVKRYRRFSNTSFLNKIYDELENYHIDKNKNDTISIFRVNYFFNEKNPELSYEESYQTGNLWIKKYFNKVEVSHQKFTDYNVIDSTLYINDKKVSYHFENSKDFELIKIEKDSIYTSIKEFGKITSTKVEFLGKTFKEVFYNENEIIKEKNLYTIYKNSYGENIIWEIRKFNSKNKLINKIYPNKNTYKLKNGVLIYRKNQKNVNTNDYGMRDRVKYYNPYYILPVSTSILFNLKLEKVFIDNFDTSNIDDDNMIYADLNFTDYATVLFDSGDIRSELVRTAKKIRRGETYFSYFKDLEVEAETVNGKKYIINLSQYPELLSFSISTFIIQEY